MCFQVTCTADCGSFTWADKTGNLPDIPVDSIIVIRITRTRFMQELIGVFTIPMT